MDAAFRRGGEARRGAPRGATGSRGLKRKPRASGAFVIALETVSLTQLQCRDLVRGHHGVPGVAVRGDRDPEWAAAPDRLALGDDAGVGDPGGVARGLLREPHAAVG